VNPEIFGVVGMKIMTSKMEDSKQTRKTKKPKMRIW